jgi:hypothetical protein
MTYIVFTCPVCIRLRESEDFAYINKDGLLVCRHCADVEVEHVEYSK